MIKKTIYRVQDGDTISSVSMRFNVTEQSIIKLNGLTCDIEMGDLLYIEVDDKLIVYKIKAIENELDIEKNTGISKDEILALNDVPYLYYGQRIFIPKK